MSADNIRAKIAGGLLKASGKVGSGAYSVYLVSETVTGGDHISKGVVTVTETLLADAIFTSFDKSDFANTAIQDGDRMLVSQYQNEINLGDKIRLKDSAAVYDYKVVSVDPVSPVGDVLVYKSQLRLISEY